MRAWAPVLGGDSPAGPAGSPRSRSRRVRMAPRGPAVDHDAAVLQHHGAVAELGDLVQGVGDQHDRAALVLELADLVQALALERLVADGEHLVDQQHVGVDVHGDREGEPHVHARGVELHLGVDELLDAGELDDLVEVLVGLRAGQAQDRGVQEDVLAPGEVGVEPGARAPAARPADRGARRSPVVGCEDAADDLEQGRLARAVVARSGRRWCPAAMSRSTSRSAQKSSWCALGAGRS